MNQMIVSPTTGLPVWQVDPNTGNSIQTGRVTSGDGLALTVTANPTNPSAGDLLLTTPDGESVMMVDSVGTKTILSAGSGAGGLDWLNAKSFGADPTGVADSAAAINKALSQAPLGGIVYLPAGTYATSVPLTIPPQVTLMGSHSSHIDSTTCAIKPTASFAGAAIILMVDQTTGGYAVPSNQQRVMDVTLDGSNLTGNSIDGIQSQGFVHGAIIQDVQIRSAPNHGMAFISNGSGIAYSWRVTRTVANGCGSHGFSPAITDCTWIDVEAIGCGGNGFNFAGSAANGEFTNCRAEFCQVGFSLSGAWGTGQGSGGMIFTGCTTDRNVLHGISITATGTTPVTFTGSSLRRDASNGSGNALHVAGATIPVTWSGQIFPGVNDDGTGTNTPVTAVSVGTSTYVNLANGWIQGASTAITDAGGNTYFQVAPNVGTATGTTSSPTITAPTNTTGLGGIATAGHALGVRQPADHGLAAWTVDPATCANSSTLTLGTLYLQAVYIAQPVTVSNIWWGLGTAVTTPTAGQNFVGIWNSSGTLLQSAGVDAAAALTGINQTAITATALAPGMYWLGILTNGATAGAMYRSGALSGTLANAGVTVAKNKPFVTNGTGLTAVATIVPASNTGSAIANFMAVS